QRRGQAQGTRRCRRRRPGRVSLLPIWIACALVALVGAGALSFAARLRARHRRFLDAPPPPAPGDAERILDQPQALYHGTRFADGSALLARAPPRGGGAAARGPRAWRAGPPALGAWSPRGRAPAQLAGALSPRGGGDPGGGGPFLPVEAVPRPRPRSPPLVPGPGGAG